MSRAEPSPQRGIGSAGRIVGSCSDGGVTRGFLLAKDTFTTIDVPGSSYTAPLGINLAGQILGVYIVGNDPYHGHGFLLDKGSLHHDYFPGGTPTTAAAHQCAWLDRRLNKWFPCWTIQP